MSRLRTLFILSVGLIAVPMFSQIDSVDVNLSPYTVIYNHLFYLQHDSYDVDRAALSFAPDELSRRTLASQLKSVLDGRGFYIDLNRIPKDSNFIDSTTQDQIYYLRTEERRIYVEKIGGRWFYSQTTAEQTDAMFNEVYPFGGDVIQHFTNPFWAYGILGFTVFQWIGLLLLVFIAALFYRILKSVFSGILSTLLRKRFGLPQTVQNDLATAARIISSLVTIRLLFILLPILHLPIRASAWIIKGLNIGSIALLVFLLVKIASIILHYFEELTQKTSSSIDDQLLPIVSRIVYIVIWSFGIIYILDYVDVNVTALLAGISIGGLAIALAAQDTVKNFLGSIMIFLDRPFQIGDVISFDNTEGVVEEVGVRSTRIRSFTNSLFYVPNGKLADKVINNVGLRKYRRFKITLGVTYDTSPDQLETFVKGLRQILNDHPDILSTNYEVHVNDLSASSIDILVYSFINTEAWKVELGTRHDLILSFLTLAKEQGVSYAYPSQSIYVEKGD